MKQLPVRLAPGCRAARAHGRARLVAARDQLRPGACVRGAPVAGDERSPSVNGAPLSSIQEKGHLTEAGPTGTSAETQRRKRVQPFCMSKARSPLQKAVPRRREGAGEQLGTSMM